MKTRRLTRRRHARRPIKTLPSAISAACLFMIASCAMPATDRLGMDCNRVVITGYWPPSNEMLRQWSTKPQAGGQGWQGKNWRGMGYDVYSFFPEFPPDGDPVGDPIGSPGSVGAVDSDLQVDYQDTSKDFWRIMADYQPRILITTSRGGDIDWELEALEGGHAGDGGAEYDWKSDGYGADTNPSPTTIDARSWNAISRYRNGVTLHSKLPLTEILHATQALEIAQVEIDQTGTSGNYLSGFMGLHGLFYNEQTPANVAAGHIHVGRNTAPGVARRLMETTLETVLKAQPPVACARP